MHNNNNIIIIKAVNDSEVITAVVLDERQSGQLTLIRSHNDNGPFLGINTVEIISVSMA